MIPEEVIRIADDIRGMRIRAVSVFIIICSTHVHWFLKPFNAMRCADAYKPQRYIINAPGFPRLVGL
jgi:hypothetical protein